MVASPQKASPPGPVPVPRSRAGRALAAAACVLLVPRPRLRQGAHMSGHVAGHLPPPGEGLHARAAARRRSSRPARAFRSTALWAVENGPCGFDPAAPAFIRSRSSRSWPRSPRSPPPAPATTRRPACCTRPRPGAPEFAVRLADPAGPRGLRRLARPTCWARRPTGRCACIEAPATHRFTDHPLGQVSIINLASVRDLGQRMGVELDPLRFRANLYVEGWPAWAENGWTGKATDAGLGAGRGVQADRPLRRHPRGPDDRRARPGGHQGAVRQLRPPASAASMCG